MTGETAAPLPPADVEHSIPGRMRLRVRARRGDARFFRHAVAELSRLPEARSVRANPHTGSILIEHVGGGNVLLDAARTRGLLDAAHPTRSVAVATATRASGKPVPSALDLAAMGLAGAGVLQLARGQVVGSASENLWNAYGLHAATKSVWTPVLLVGLGLFQVARGEVLGSATSLFLYALSARRIARHRAAGDTT